MNNNLDKIFSTAANSNLTANAVEFVPRSTVSFSSRPGPSQGHNDNGYYRNDKSRPAYDSRYDDRDVRVQHHYRHNEYSDRPKPTYKHNHDRLERNERQKNYYQDDDYSNTQELMRPKNHYRETSYYNETHERWEQNERRKNYYKENSYHNPDYAQDRENSYYNSFQRKPERNERQKNYYQENGYYNSGLSQKNHYQSDNRKTDYHNGSHDKERQSYYYQNENNLNGYHNDSSYIDDTAEHSSYPQNRCTVPEKRKAKSVSNEFYNTRNENEKSKNECCEETLLENRSYKANKHKSSIKNSTKCATTSIGVDSICQRDRLIEQLNKGVHECLICCEVIKQREPVWNCSNCYYVLHMWCVIKWARSSTADTNCWRCPACQHEYEKVPDKYMCFCGKSKLQTEWNRSDTAHSCGEMCARSRENPTPWFVCEHKCTLLCHPGPCPACTIQVTRECGCGRTQRSVQCSTKADILCGAICDRLLNCGKHRCTRTCHPGECGTCSEKVQVECHCGKKTDGKICGVDMLGKFSCAEKCGRRLMCDNHDCDELCHEGECGLCPRAPIVLNKCACGKTPIAESTRTSCLDEVPTCDQVCGKILKCGPANRRHLCEKKCHEGECGPCPKKTTLKCRCGALDKSLLCVEINSKVADFRCQKKCTKKRSCGKHKCNQTCCIDIEHICSQRCNNSLSCGKHRCDLLCHRGKCGRCLESSFEELYCHCGHSVIYPPVSCGTRPPECNQPCRRVHDCEHPPLHTCHPDDVTCPPCTVFTDKLCYGGHELRKTIPCYQKEFSCGLPCGAPLPCGSHRCQAPCHAGDCVSSSKKCVQPCVIARDLCGHRCAAACHTGACPVTLCKEMVTVTCACGNIVAKHPCFEHTDDYRRIIMSTLAAKMTEMQTNASVNIGDVSEKITAQTINLRTLECSDECKLIMRNRRLALALQIQNPDLSAKLTPKYSDFMKSWAKKDPNLCQHVHDKLTALVKLAKESKQKNRSFSFEVMNKEKRQLVHEYCAHFGCESEAYDAEPKRNVVAIATKGRCWLPSYSLLETVQREMGQRKVPMPVFNKKSNLRDCKGGLPEPTRIILPVLPSTSASQGGINYFGR